MKRVVRCFHPARPTALGAHAASSEMYKYWLLCLPLRDNIYGAVGQASRTPACKDLVRVSR